MEHGTYASRLRYLDADDVDDSTVDFSGMDVRASDGSKLGDIDGFIIESTTGRIYHIVVDSAEFFVWPSALRSQPSAIHALARNRTWSTTFAKSRANPAHSEDHARS